MINPDRKEVIKEIKLKLKKDPYKDLTVATLVAAGGEVIEKTLYYPEEASGAPSGTTHNYKIRMPDGTIIYRIE